MPDAKEFFQALLQSEVTIKPTKFLKAAQRDKQNWNRWLKTIATDDQGGLTAEGVLEAIKDNATDDAVFGLDVGNNTEWAIRQLPLNKQQTFTMSAWYGTMGFGLPAGLAAQLNYPKKQVWSISGDGGYAMVMPDLLTEVKYHLPVINVVLENKVLGFIQHEKLLANQAPYGIDLIGADWAKMADNMGAIGFKVTNLKELKATFQKVTQLQQNGNQLPIVIDAKIKNVDPIDTSFVPVDPENFDADTIAKYRERYGIAEADQPALSQLLNEL